MCIPDHVLSSFFSLVVLTFSLVSARTKIVMQLNIDVCLQMTVASTHTTHTHTHPFFICATPFRSVFLHAHTHVHTHTRTLDCWSVLSPSHSSLSNSSLRSPGSTHTHRYTRSPYLLPSTIQTFVHFCLSPRNTYHTHTHTRSLYALLLSVPSASMQHTHTHVCAHPHT